MMKKEEKFFYKNGIQKKTYTELSKPDDRKRKSLIESDVKDAYSFDEITQLFFPKIYPSSTDAILFKNKNVYLIEFKTGFEREKFDQSQCTCPHIDEKVCEDYAKLLKQHRNNIDKELKANLFQKAAESRWVLDKHLLPQMGIDKDSIKVFLKIVIDKVKEDPLEFMAETMDELSNREDLENIYENMNNSLKKLYCENKFTRCPSLYNEAKVLSVDEFKAEFLGKSF